MREEIKVAAESHLRTMNAEIIGRLQSTFDAPASPQLTPEVRSAVEREIERHGGTAEEALLRLVQAGEQRTGLVLNLSLQSGMKVHELNELVQKLVESLPEHTEVMLRTLPPN